MSTTTVHSNYGAVTYLQQLINIFSDGVLVEDADRKILMVNQRFLSLFSIPVSPDDMVGYDCAAAAEQAKGLFNDPEQFLKDSRELPKAGKEHKEMVAMKDGRFFLRKYAPIHEHGQIVCHVWHYEEITALKNKEDELMAQKEFFHRVLSELPADIAIFSPGHRYMYLNKTAVKSDGIRKWMIGKDDYEYCEMRNLDTSIADARRAKFNECKEARQSVSWVDELEDKEGKPNYMLRIFYPYINTNNDLEFVIGYGVNITKQKEQELVLAQEKERFSTLIATLNDGVFQMTFDGEIQLHNYSFLKAMGLQGKEIPKQYQREVMVNVHQEDKSLLYAAFDRLKETKLPQQGTFRMIDPRTGKTKYIEYYIWYRYTQSDGGVAAGRLSDVTERVLREEQMQSYLDKEKQLSHMKSHFIHITSHELRTPLSVILSSAEMLEMSNEDKEVAKLVDRPMMTGSIIREVNRITTILNELLLVGRIESGQVKFEPENADVKKCVEMIADELFRPYKDDRHLVLEVADNVPEAYLDRNLMRYAMINLLSNAFKYSKGKKAPELKVFTKNGNLHLKVTDHGIGIPAQDQPKLFNSFYRASNVGNISGTGIGLMVVEHVAKVHKGKIEINSKQGDGSVFTLILPLTNKANGTGG